MNVTASQCRPKRTIDFGSKRLRWTLGVGAFAVLVVLAYVHFFLHLPMGRGPAGPSVDPELFIEPWTKEHVLLVGVGDSVTAGFGAAKGHSYFDRLAANSPDEFPEMKGLCLSRAMPELTTLNLANSGSNSLQHLAH